MIRKAKPSDLESICALGLEALNNDPYENLIIDEKKVYEVANSCISCPSDFAYVSEVGGKVVASVIAQVTPMLFYKRNQANVIQFYSREPGEGIKLLRELNKWWRSRNGIKSLVFTMECGADPRIIKLLERLGLKTELPVMMATK